MRRRCRAQPSAGETNIHGALKAAIGLHDKDSLEADLDPIPDTVYFLTDGSPTRGEITDADTLLSWFEFLNRYAKVELHVIAMGNLGVDLPFLRRLAKVGGGSFIHVRRAVDRAPVRSLLWSPGAGGGAPTGVAGIESDAS